MPTAHKPLWKTWFNRNKAVSAKSDPRFFSSVRRPASNHGDGRPERPACLELEVSWEEDGVRLVLSEPGSLTSQTVVPRRRHPVDWYAAQKVTANIYSALEEAAHQPRGASNRVQEVRGLGQDLLDLLLDSETKSVLLSAPARFLTLKIDDRLVDIPWELLWDGQQFLCERFAIGRQVMTELQVPESGRMREGGAYLKVAVLGSGIEEMETVSEEGRGIHRALPGDRFDVSVNLLATVADLKKALKTADLIHFCGHAEFDNERPERSSLRLGETERLTAEEISHTLAGTENVPRLVFLNACGSGKSGPWTRQTARAAFGLGNAFLMRGVGHVIVTSGDVSDETSAKIGVAFHRHLAQGAPIGEALRRAREADGTERLLGMPYALYGSPQSLLREEGGVVASEATDAEYSPTTVLRVFLFTDLVGSTDLKSRLGDSAAAKIFSKHDALFRDSLSRFGGIEEKETGDGFLASFDLPSQAIRCALSFERELRDPDAPEGLRVRMGLHMGEIIRVPDGEAESHREKLVGLILDTTARVMELALPDQILLTRGLFDSARQHFVADSEEHPVAWCAHGPFVIKGLEEPIEVFEVGIPGLSPLRIPENTEKAKSALPAGDEVTLGWRPAAGIEIPFRENWCLLENLGEGGFGEVWLAQHKKTKDRRVFKFCFEADRMRGLKREVTLFRLIKETLGDRDDIAKLLDWNFDETPFFLETEYTEAGDLKDWAEKQGGLDRIPLETRLELVAQTAEALAAAHSVGIIHKDVKARNILVSTDLQGRPRAVLTDFGIGQIEDSNLLLQKGITFTGVTKASSPGSSSTDSGTRLYMAPEIVEGKVGTTSSDVYSLGVLLYQAISGDFSRALATGWERDVEDDFLREDIALCVDRLPARRLKSGTHLADRLRSLDNRHSQREAEQKAKEEAARTKILAERQRKRQKVFLVSALVGFAVVAFTSWFAIHESQRAQELEMSAEREKQARLEAETQRGAAVEAKEVAEREFYYSQVSIADRLIKDAQFGGAREILAKCPEWMRHWEWGYLQYLCNNPYCRILEGNTAWVGQIRFSPDGKWLASASRDGSVQLWNVESGEKTDECAEKGATSWGASFSPDGKLLAFSLGVPRDATTVWQIGVWDLASGSKTFFETRHTDLIWSVEFSPDGKQLLTGSYDTYAKLWDVETRSLVHTFRPHPDQVWSVAFSPDGKRIATGCAHYPLTDPKRRMARIWDAETGEVICQLAGHSAEVSGVAFSPDGSLVATGGWDGAAKLWETETWGEIWTSPNHESTVIHVSFSPDGRFLATAGRDGRARVFDVSDGSEMGSPLEGHFGRLHCVTFSPDGNLVATSGEDGTIRLWNLESPKDVLAGHEDAVHSIAFSRDGKLIVTGSRDHTAKLWDLESGSVIHTFDHEDRVYGVAISPDGRWVGTTSKDKTAAIWDAKTGKSLLPFGEHFDTVHGIASSPDGKRVATASLDKTVRIWDAKSGDELLQPLEHGDGVWAIDFSPDGKRLATACADGTATVWNAKTGGEIVRLVGHTGIVADIVFSPDGRRIATASSDGTARIWNAVTGECLFPLSGHKDWVTDVAFSPDGKRVVTVSRDATAIVWDADTGRSILRLEGHKSYVFSVAFSPDGKLIATGGNDKTVRLWRAFPW